VVVRGLCGVPVTREHARVVEAQSGEEIGDLIVHPVVQAESEREQSGARRRDQPAQAVRELSPIAYRSCQDTLRLAQPRAATLTRGASWVTLLPRQARPAFRNECVGEAIVGPPRAPHDDSGRSRVAEVGGGPRRELANAGGGVSDAG